MFSARHLGPANPLEMEGQHVAYPCLVENGGMADGDDFINYFGLNLTTIVRVQGFLVLRVVPKP